MRFWRVRARPDTTRQAPNRDFRPLHASNPDIFLTDLSDHRAAVKAIITANGKHPPIGDGRTSGQEALASDADTRG